MNIIFYADFRKVIPYLVASVINHSGWIANNLNDKHPLFLSRCWRQGNQESLKPYVLQAKQMSCSVTEMQATGIPPTYIFMHNQAELNDCIIRAIERGINLDPAPHPERTSTGTFMKRTYVLCLPYMQLKSIVLCVLDERLDRMEELLNQILASKANATIVEIAVPSVSSSSTSSSTAPSAVICTDGSSSYRFWTWKGKLRPIPHDYAYPKKVPHNP